MVSMGDVVKFALTSDARTEPEYGSGGASAHGRSTPVLRVVPEVSLLAEAPVAPRPVPSRRAVVRAEVWGLRTPVSEPAPAPVAETATPGTVTVTGVSEVLRLPGHADSKCYRIAFDVSCAAVEGALPTVIGMELGGTSANVMPRRTTLRPGDQQLTMVVSGPVAEQRLTLVYELDGARHRASVELDARTA
jgi:hypothetical protein